LRTPDRLRRTTDLLFPAFWRTHGRSHFQFIELADRRPVILAGATVTPFRVVHKSGAPAFALRVSRNGCTVAYSGDTE
jgi:ribonuclease BN (tRNA processing enzyme)